ncbi:MAG: methyltransferase domain-containing protein [Candidatus Heimdallarchaeota archaeon]
MSERVSDHINEVADQYQFNPALVNRLSFVYGFERAKSIIQSLTVHPGTLPIRVNTLLTTPDDLVKSLNEKEIPAKRHPDVEDAVLVDVQGPNEVAEKTKKIIVHKYAAAKALIGGAIGAPGIKDHEDLNIGDEVSIVDKMGKIIVANAVLMMNSNEIDNQKRGVALRITASKYVLPNFQNVTEYLRGHFIEQMVPSILMGSEIKLAPQARVLDLSVGHGALLTHVWQNNTKSNARIIAVDNSNTRLVRFKSNLKRLRLLNAPIEIMKMESNKVPKKFNRNETFDCIIYHAPNSKIGIRPKVSDNTTEGLIFNNARNMNKMMAQADRLLKRGGTIYYSTNSLDPAENERIIEEVINHGRLSVVEQSQYIGEKGLVKFKGSELLQYFFPDRHDTQGYFIAKLTK